MSVKILQDFDFGSVAKATNLPAPTASSDAATKGYVDTAIDGLAWKENCRVATQSNLNLAAPGATIDGIAMASLDRVLVRSQSTASENGIYVWNGAAVSMTRSADCSTADDLESAVTTVDEGTSADATYRQDAINFTLGSGSVTWVSFGTSAPSASETQQGIIEIATQAETDTGTDDARAITPLKLKTSSLRAKSFAANVGDGAATQYTVTHNLGSRDVLVQVVRNAAPYDTVFVDVERDTTNAVIVRFASAPASNAYRVLVGLVPA